MRIEITTSTKWRTKLGDDALPLGTILLIILVIGYSEALAASAAAQATTVAAWARVWLSC